MRLFLSIFKAASSLSYFNPTEMVQKTAKWKIKSWASLFCGVCLAISFSFYKWMVNVLFLHLNLAERIRKKGGGRTELLSLLLFKCGLQKKCPLLFLYNARWLEEVLIHTDGMWVERVYTHTHTHANVWKRPYKDSLQLKLR